jgi:hypothetical protein
MTFAFYSAHLMSSPIELVDKLQKLVLSTYPHQEVSDPYQLYKAKRCISDLCLSCANGSRPSRVYGPIGWYEKFLALLSRASAESCQESSALYLVTSLGVADLIATSPEGHLSLRQNKCRREIP